MTSLGRFILLCLLSVAVVACDGGDGDVLPVSTARAEARPAPPPVTAPGSPFEEHLLDVPPRSHHEGVLLGDGTLFVAGGVSETGALRTAFLYDPRDFSVRLLPPMATPRIGHSMTRLAGPDGQHGTLDDRVLIVGGFDGQRLLDTMEVFHPASGEFRLLEERLPVPLARHQAVRTAPRATDPARPWTGPTEALLFGGVTALGPEHVAVTGGFGVRLENGRAHVRELPAPRFARVGHTASLLGGPDRVVGTADDRILLFGGTGCDPREPGAHHRVLADPELYRLIASDWVELRDLSATSASDSVNPLSPRRDHSAVRLADGSILFVGGTQSPPGNEDPDPLAAVTLRYIPSPEKPEAGILRPSRALQLPRLAPELTLLPDGRVLVAGGLGSGNLVLDAVELYDPDEETFDLLEATLRTERIHHTQHYWNGPDEQRGTRDDRILLIGGLDGSGNPTYVVEETRLGDLR